MWRVIFPLSFCVLITAYPNPRETFDYVSEIFSDKHFTIEPTEDCNEYEDDYKYEYGEPANVIIDDTKVSVKAERPTKYV